MSENIKIIKKLKIVTTGSVFSDYNNLIKKIELNLSSKKINIHNYDSNIVRERLVQRIIELTCISHTKKVLDNENKNHKVNYKFFNLNGVKINSENGKIDLSLKVYFFNLLIFVIFWFLNFKCAIISFFSNSLTKSLPSTILMEAEPYYINTDKNLVEFCKYGPITSLSEAPYIIIKSKIKPKKQSNPNIEYYNDPLHKILRHRLSFQDKLVIFFIILKVPFFFIKTIFCNPITIVIAKDFVNLLLFKWLDEKKLIKSINITTSSLRVQPLWLRNNKNFTTSLIWYSQNSRPLIFKDEKFKADLPYFRHMRVDNHWVWTQGFKKYLESFGLQSKINVVGPLLWYLPSKKLLPKIENFNIVLFDVIPTLKKFSGNGRFREYYTTKLMKKFVNDVLQTCQTLEKKFNVKIFIDIKHKRILNKFHDMSYINFLDDLIFKNKRFNIMNYNVNLYDVLKITDLSIAIPYTSTAYISSKLKKNALYYDPLGELIPTFEKSKFISFSSNKLDLERKICQTLNFK